MSIRRIAVGTLAYLAVTFPLAYVWHLVAFESTYADLGYISREEPIIAFGLLAILIQGVVLSTACSLLPGGRGRVPAVCGLIAVYHWSMHVLAEAAKHPIAPLPTWFALETGYLLVQFALATIVLTWVFRETDKTTNPEPE